MNSSLDTLASEDSTMIRNNSWSNGGIIDQGTNTSNAGYTLKLLYLITLVVMVVVGAIGNALVIGAVLIHRKLRVLSNVFIVNLAVTDLIISIVINSFFIVGVLTEGQWFISHEGMCKLTASLCIITCACSIWTMFAISINRYICICHHFVYLSIFNKRTMSLYVLAVWIAGVLLDAPVMLGWGKHSYNSRSLHCALDYTTGYNYRLFLLFVGFGCPLNGLIFCYSRIYFYARSSQNNLKKYQANISDKKKNGAIKASDIKLLRSILIIVIMFVALWAPYALILLLDTALSWPRSVLILAVCMAHVSSMVNSIIYAATNKNFRDGYVHLIKVCFCNYLFCSSEKDLDRKGIMIASIDSSNTIRENRQHNGEKLGFNV